jgi:diketogulonate reductase-like aldo/keto reductase
MESSITLNNGYKMPLLGLGTWKSPPGEVEAAVRKALELGYRHIDCAYGYGNEDEVGKGLKYGLEELKIPREEIFVTSKLWNTFHNPEDVEPVFQKSLKALGLDYLDLYLIHWPVAFKRGEDNFPKNPDGSVKYDVDIHPTTTWLAMEPLVQKGLVKSIGLSNFNSVQVQDILDKGAVISKSENCTSTAMQPFLPTF